MMRWECTCAALPMHAQRLLLAIDDVLFDFGNSAQQNQGWAFGVYSADGLFSVGVNSAQNDRSRTCVQVDAFPESAP